MRMSPVGLQSNIIALAHTHPDVMLSATMVSKCDVNAHNETLDCGAGGVEAEGLPVMELTQLIMSAGIAEALVSACHIWNPTSSVVTIKT